jgi:SAM-dependent methyltransferase
MTINILRKRRQLLEDCPRQTDHYISCFEFDAGDLAEAMGGFSGKRVLDAGCGLSYPHVVIFQSLGADVVGVDVDVIEPRARVRSVLRLAGRQGIPRTLRDCVVATVQNPGLSAEICRRMGVTGKLPQPDIREGDALNLDFPDDSFDLIYSHAVYEHLPNVGQALDEALRTLKPGGVLRLAIHLYASLTGGHTGRIGAIGKSVPPWDHLRERSVPATSYLNELRENDFRKEVEARFDVLKFIPCRREQDAELLTEDIERELAEKGYLRDELLTETLVVHARKPSQVSA